MWALHPMLGRRQGRAHLVLALLTLVRIAAQPQLHWYSVNGSLYPMESGFTCGDEEYVSDRSYSMLLPNPNASGGGVRWGPLSVVSLSASAQLVVGLRPFEGRYGPARGDVLWTGDAGRNWWCLRRNDALVGRAGAVVFQNWQPFNDPMQQQRGHRSICIAGGRSYARPDSSGVIEAATSDVSCLTLLEPSSEAPIEGYAQQLRPPRVAIFTAPPLPSAAVGLTHVTVAEPELSGESQHLLVGGLRQDQSVGIWHMRWAIQDRYALEGVDNSTTLVKALLPVSWRSIPLISSDEDAAQYRRLGGIALWLPDIKRLLFAGGSIDLRNDGSVNGTGTDSPFLPSADQTAVDVGTGASLLTTPLVQMLIWDVLPALMDGSNSSALLPAPLWPLELPEASSRLPYHAYSLSLPPLNVSSAWDAAIPEPVPLAWRIRMYFQRAANAYILQLSSPAGADSGALPQLTSHPIKHYLSFSALDGATITQQAPGALLAAAAWDLYDGANSSEFPFPHVLAADSASGLMWRGTTAACTVPAGCPLGTYPSGCTHSPTDSICAPCQFCDWIAGRGWWCGWVGHPVCDYACTPCPPGALTVARCDDLLSKNLTHDTCASNSSWEGATETETPSSTGTSSPSPRPDDGGGDIPIDCDGMQADHPDCKAPAPTVLPPPLPAGQPYDLSGLEWVLGAQTAAALVAALWLRLRYYHAGTCDECSSGGGGVGAGGTSKTSYHAVVAFSGPSTCHSSLRSGVSGGNLAIGPRHAGNSGPIAAPSGASHIGGDNVSNIERVEPTSAEGGMNWDSSHVSDCAQQQVSYANTILMMPRNGANGAGDKVLRDDNFSGSAAKGDQGYSNCNQGRREMTMLAGILWADQPHSGPRRCGEDVSRRLMFLLRLWVGVAAWTLCVWMSVGLLLPTRGSTTLIITSGDAAAACVLFCTALQAPFAVWLAWRTLAVGMAAGVAAAVSIPSLLIIFLLFVASAMHPPLLLLSYWWGLTSVPVDGWLAGRAGQKKTVGQSSITKRAASTAKKQATLFSVACSLLSLVSCISLTIMLQSMLAAADSGRSVQVLLGLALLLRLAATADAVLQGVLLLRGSQGRMRRGKQSSAAAHELFPADDGVSFVGREDGARALVITSNPVALIAGPSISGAAIPSNAAAGGSGLPAVFNSNVRTGASARHALDPEILSLDWRDSNITDHGPSGAVGVDFSSNDQTTTFMPSIPRSEAAAAASSPPAAGASVRLASAAVDINASSSAPAAQTVRRPTDVMSLLSELMLRAVTPEGRHLASHRIFFRRNPHLLSEAVEAVQQFPLSNKWLSILRDLDASEGAEAPQGDVADAGVSRGVLTSSTAARPTGEDLSSSGSGGGSSYRSDDDNILASDDDMEMQQGF